MSGLDDVLGAVLDRLVPADGELPGAGGLGLAGEVDARLPERARALLAALPAGFARAPVADQVAALRRLEGEAPKVFADLVAVVYAAYYVDPRVLERIERRTGYPARPPQPLGHELEPFDEAVLATVRTRAPSYREAPVSPPADRGA